MNRAARSRTASPRIARAGFSLLELAIVIVIFASVATLGLEMVSKLLSRRAHGATQAQLVALDEALVKFYRIYGRLPCPADRATLPTSTSYGNEGDCSTGGDVTSGMIPFRAMNLPVSAILDGYGNRINYAVSRLLSTSSTTFAANTAKIEVRSGQLQQPCSTVCSVLANPGASEGAAYFLYSGGEDKRGTVSSFGVATACYSSTSDTRIDTQNCANGALTVGISASVYYDSRFNNGLVTANYFDDTVVWRTKGRLM